MAWETRIAAGYESGYATEANDGSDEVGPSFIDMATVLTGNFQAPNGARDTTVVVPVGDPTSWRAGWWARCRGPGFDQPTILIVRNAADISEMGITFNTGIMKMTAGPVTLDYIHQTCTPIATGNDYWNHYGFVFTPDICSFYINGKRVLTSGHDEMDCHKLWVWATGATGSLYALDDFYLQASDDTEEDLAPPALRFYPIYPQQTLQAEWTKSPSTLEDSIDAYENGAVPDDDETYLFSMGGSLRERYKFYNVPMAIPDVHVVRNVTIQTTARDLGVGGIKFFADNGVDENLSGLKDTKTIWGGEAQYVMDTDPSGDPWTLESVGQSEYGMES